MAEGRRYQAGQTDTFATVSQRIQNPEGFYSKDWDEGQQEEDEWQVPDKWQRISQMVFCNIVLEIHLVRGGAISSLRTQHQGGRFSTSAE